MIFCFKTPVQIAKRRAVLTLDTEELDFRCSELPAYIEFWRGDSATTGVTYVCVPYGNIRYWRNNDDPKQTTDEAE